MAGARSATAFAPASVGNVAVGFDILGHALDAVGDRVTATRIAEPLVRVTRIDGVATALPYDVERNTAARAVAAMHAALALPFGIELAIDKGIPLGSGMGGSAASASAALVAANALLDVPLPLEALYPYALDGEAVASGGRHGDNLGAQLLGGLVLSTAHRLIKLPVPAGLTCVLVHPDAVLETRRARDALRGTYAIDEFVAQSANLALVLAGCYRGDRELIRAGLVDVLVEPRRAPLVAGFTAVKQTALEADALGASISGAGPSVFAWFADTAAAAAAAPRMAAAFSAAHGGKPTDVYVSAVDAPGARVIARDGEPA